MNLLKANYGMESDASLSMRFSREKGKRSLHILRQDPPWRVVRSFQVNEQDCLTHIHNMSGGILSGDRLMMRVQVEEGSRVLLTSTGATRIYKHREGRATAHNVVCLSVGKNAVLEYLPDQIIPYAGSRFHQETDVELASEGAGLFWWETLTPGRAASGEKFSYETLGIRSHIVCGGRPLAIEQFVIEPSRRSPQRVGMLGRFECFSTFYICKTGLALQRWAELQALLEDEADLLSTPDLCWGASRLVEHGIVVRGVGFESALLVAGLTRFWNIAKLFLYGRRAIPPRKMN
jgi:urease accessory protein